MALNGNYISIYSTIERIYRDAGYQDVDWTDSVEWIADALRLIGAKGIFKVQSTNGFSYNDYSNPSPITITDYRGDLPTGYINYIAARKIGLNDQGEITNFYPMVYNTDLFSQTPFEEVEVGVSAGVYDALEFPQVWDDTTLEVIPIIVNGIKELASSEYAYTYRINDSKIETNFKQGYVELVYLTFVTDERGFPMIPDNVFFEKAVAAYITERLDYKAWRKGTIPDKIYRDSQQEWAFYCKAADVKASMPNLDKMESLKNMLLRTSPIINRYDTGFKYANIPERRKF